MITFDIDTQKYIGDSPETYTKFLDIINTFVSDNLTGIAVVEVGANLVGWCRRSPIDSFVGTITIEDGKVEYAFRWTSFYNHALNKGLILDRTNLIIDRCNLSEEVEGFHLFAEDCFVCSSSDIDDFKY